jgi:hypothetical protein
MNDDQMRMILSDFANDHTLAKDIEVIYTPCGIQMKSKKKFGAKIEDANMLLDLARGAEHLLLWARRTGRVRFRKHAKRSIK